jgi:hypothetical protein
MSRRYELMAQQTSMSKIAGNFFTAPCIIMLSTYTENLNCHTGELAEDKGDFCSVRWQLCV